MTETHRFVWFVVQARLSPEERMTYMKSRWRIYCKGARIAFQELDSLLLSSYGKYPCFGKVCEGKFVQSTFSAAIGSNLSVRQMQS
jgi:hypothetical protein